MPRLILAAVTGFLMFLTSVNAQSGRPTAGKQKRTTTMNLSEAIQFIRPSVVQILFRFNSPPASGGVPLLTGRPAPLGTGFLVNEDGYVVTALHVVRAFENLQGQGQKHLLVGIAAPNLNDGRIEIRNAFGLTECDIIDEDARHDLALLRLKQNPFKGELGTLAVIDGQKIDYEHKAATLSPGRPLDGEAIAVSGYPLSGKVLITTSGNLASAWAYDVGDVHPPGSPEWFRFPDVADSYLADVQVNGGNSGGPVYSVESGNVIGVCVAFANAPVRYSDGDHEPASAGNRPLSYNSGLSVVVPIGYVIEMLKKKNLNWLEKAAH